MAENKLLILRLEGALQSWGATSKWDDRDTEDFPTKSGIVGLLGCAMGISRGDPALAELNAAITIAVRADRRGERITDFQTVTGSPLRNAEGKPKSTGNTLISERVYLQDACFSVFIETEPYWHDRIISALNAPKWCMYLGRKACVPSRPVLECADPEYASLNVALIGYPPADRPTYPMTYETEQPDDSLSSITRPDSLIHADRGFVRRTVWKGSIKEEDDVSDKN